MKTTRLLRSEAARIWTAALRAVDPEIAALRFAKRKGSALTLGTRTYDLASVKRVWVLGAGKAAASMGHAIEKVLGRYLAGGILVTKYGHGAPLRKLEVIEAGHPLPDGQGLRAGERIANLARSDIGPRDLVICLLSGGGSALLVSPAAGISLADKLACTDLLLKAGATIHELNAVRKHLSNLKGGGLARLLRRTPAVSLILSDVVGDALDTIASGPLEPDRTTFQECLEILARLDVAGKVPVSVVHRLEAGLAGAVPETPKPGDPLFRLKQSIIVGSNTQACTAAAAAARRLGYHTMILTTGLEGDTGEAAAFHLSIAGEVVAHGRPVRRPACILSGGETTVKVAGTGKGGRNQEFSLRCAAGLARLAAPCLVVSLGTDGTDGPTDAAGAMADNSTLSRSRRYGARFLESSLLNNDSYEFFRKLDDLIITGPTRTNVMDLHIILIG
jgi:hydroxypyruvate reductase